MTYMKSRSIIILSTILLLTLTLSSIAQEPGTQKWVFPERATYSPAIGSDGTLYVSSDNTLYAVNPNLTKKWSFHSGGHVTIGTDGTIYLGADKLYALTPQGNEKWSFEPSHYSEKVQTSAVIGNNGTIFVGSNEGSVYAITPRGKTKWSYELFENNYDEGLHPTDLFVGPQGNLYVISSNQTLTSFDADGDKRWSNSKGHPYSIGSDGTIYVNVGIRLFKVNPDGTSRMLIDPKEFDTDDRFTHAPVIGPDGTIYIGAYLDGYVTGGMVGKRKLYAINPDGTLKWKVRVGSSEETTKFLGTPVVGGDGSIYVASDTSKIFAVNPDGSEKWVFERDVTSNVPPVIGPDGTIYVNTSDEKLIAINGSNGGLADSSWPMYKHDPQHTGNLSQINIPPTVDFTFSPKEPNIGEKINFDASASNDQDGHAVQFKWDWDDDWSYDDTFSSPTATHTFSTPGDHKVTLEVIDNNGASDKFSKIVSVKGDNSPPNPDPMTWNIEPKADGTNSIAMQATTATDPEGNGVEYRFAETSDHPDTTGSAWQESNSFTTDGLQSGEKYCYKVKARDQSPNQNETEWSSIKCAETKIKHPVADLTYSPKYPKTNTSIEFDASGTTDPDGTIETYRWDWENDGSYDQTSTSPTVKHSYSDPSDYKVRLQVVDDDGRTDQTTETVSVSAPEEPINFPDKNLENAIRAEIGKNSGDILPDDLENLNNLQANGVGIKDLTGISYCKNLSTLWLGDNEISDINPLAKLEKLTNLGLDGNKLNDIQPLANLTNLEILFLRHNKIVDITPLEDLESLTDLYLDDNRIASISTLVRNDGLGSGSEGGLGDTIRITENYLDLGEGSDDMQDIQALFERGAHVEYEPQKTLDGLASFKDQPEELTELEENESKTIQEIVVSDNRDYNHFDVTFNEIHIENTGTALGSDLELIKVKLYSYNRNTNLFSKAISIDSFPLSVQFQEPVPTLADDASGRLEIIPTVSPNPTGGRSLKLKTTLDYSEGEKTFTDFVIDEKAKTIVNNKPPNPNPLTWATEPHVVTGPNSIEMEASTATDPEGNGVEYYFEETTGNSGSDDSSWKDSTSYEDSGLKIDTQYCYQVKARDKSDNQNESDWSSERCVTTSNQSPTADAGPDRNINLTEVSTLDGTGSSDPEGDTLSYSWSILSDPVPDSISLEDVLTDPTSAKPKFFPTDTGPSNSGAYRFELEVSDSNGNSDTDTVKVVATPATGSVKGNSLDSKGVKGSDPSPIDMTDKVDLEVKLSNMDPSEKGLMGGFKYEVANFPDDKEYPKEVAKYVDAKAVGLNSGVARVSLNYTDEEVTKFVEEDMKLYVYNNGSWEEASNIDVDTSNNVILGNIPVSKLSGSPITATSNQEPTADFNYSPSEPSTEDNITFDASGSSDPDGEIVEYKWDWGNDGDYEDTSTSPTIEHTFSEPGVHTVVLEVMDEQGGSDDNSQTIPIQNAKTIKIENPSWNMVSVPLMPAQHAPQSVFSKLNQPGQIHHWDPSLNNGKGGFLTPDTGYNQVSPIEGMWVYLENTEVPKEITFQGIHKSSREVTLSQAGWHQVGAHVKHYWSEVGVKQGKDGEPLSVYAQADGPDAPHWMSRFLWEWDSDQNEYVAYDPKSQKKEMSPGEGFWIKTYEENIRLMIPFTPSSPGPPGGEAKGTPLSELSEDVETPPAPPPVPSADGQDLLAVKASPNPAQTNQVTFQALMAGVDGVKVSLYDASGAIIYESQLKEGTNVTWNLTDSDGGQVPNGIYLYQLEARGESGQTLASPFKKLLVLR